MLYVKSFVLIAKVQCVAGKIGPPKLSLSREGDKIVVDIYHPPFPSVEVLPWIADLTYLVTFRDSGNKVSSKVKTST